MEAEPLEVGEFGGDIGLWYAENDYERGIKLGRVPGASGHDCYLKGVRVQADFIAPQYIWLQYERYHFADIISSQSKMHMLPKMMKLHSRDLCFNRFVDQRAIDLVAEKLAEYESNPNKETFETVVANTPSGLLLGAGVDLNYLQLKTMYNQRKNHKLEFWNTVFKQWVEGLPMFMELTQKGED
jgi:hypothetical protein